MTKKISSRHIRFLTSPLSRFLTFPLSRFPLYLFSFFVLLTSCKTQKKFAELPAPVKLKGEEIIQMFDSVVAHQFSFDWLSAKASVDYIDANNNETSFDINLRMRKDSAIWISVTPLLGIEVARVLITPGELCILDRIHKTCTRHEFTFIDSLLKTKVNFEIMQAVIVGNYFPYLKNEKLKSMYEDSTFVILSTLSKHKAKRVQEDKDPNKPIIQDFWIDANYKINRSRITDDKLNRQLEANYQNFFDVNGKLFPQNIFVNIAASSFTKIKVEYNKVTTGEEVAMPFAIPEKYEKQ